MHKISNHETVEDLDKAIESLQRSADRYINQPFINRAYQLRADNIRKYKEEKYGKEEKE